MRNKLPQTVTPRWWLLVLLWSVPQIASAQPASDLVDVQKLDSTIVIDLRYATADNFLHDTLYSANICLLRAPVAAQLVKVHKALRQQGFGLKVWDAYRPLSVQKKMWQKLPDPRYVADPARGSMHNRGAAVDVTLVDLMGKEVEMPTAFDDFSPRAGSEYPQVSEAATRHRQILQEAMTAFGFRTITSEWWHFYYYDSRDYPLLDVPLDAFRPRR